MCMVDLDDMDWTVYVDERRRARKSHVCCECRREIEPGEEYLYAHGLFDNRWVDHKTCVQCRAAARWLEYVCHGWLYTHVIEDLGEHINEVETRNDWTLAVLVTAARVGWGDMPEDAVRGWVSASLELYRERLREIG